MPWCMHVLLMCCSHSITSRQRQSPTAAMPVVLQVQQLQKQIQGLQQQLAGSQASFAKAQVS